MPPCSRYYSRFNGEMLKFPIARLSKPLRVRAIFVRRLINVVWGILIWGNWANEILGLALISHGVFIRDVRGFMGPWSILTICSK